MSLANFNGFHILTANIEYVIYVREKISCCPIVSHRLDLTAINMKCGLHEALAISGYIGVSNKTSLV
ncbi:hypothetical protein D3C76_649090 [compost metagenome]